MNPQRNKLLHDGALGTPLHVTAKSCVLNSVHCPHLVNRNVFVSTCDLCVCYNGWYCTVRVSRLQDSQGATHLAINVFGNRLPCRSSCRRRRAWHHPFIQVNWFSFKHSALLIELEIRRKYWTHVVYGGIIAVCLVFTKGTSLLYLERVLAFN